ncbi:MAG: Gfo/Idh/MocA family oxidoreductase [Nocardioidaceae bacterium]
MTETTPVRWGILSTGRIASSFAANLAHVPGARIAAVGSRSQASADEFAGRFARPDCRTYASYDELVADPDVDVVYVGSPHALHLEHGTLALEAGKPVLVEKPLTLNAADSERLVELARARGLFLMEAMWMACNPLIRTLREGLAAGRWGTPRQVHADLGFVVDAGAGDRLVETALGAGALLDMGIYPLTFAHLMLGPAERLVATAGLSEAGYDQDIAIAGRYAGGAVAALTASMTSASPRAATIATSTGIIDLPADFHHPPHAVFQPGDGGPAQRIEASEPLLGTGLGNEAAEVGRCLRAGLLESPLVPHEQTLTLMRQMDDLRRQVGVRYPGDPTS